MLATVVLTAFKQYSHVPALRDRSIKRSGMILAAREAKRTGRHGWGTIYRTCELPLSVNFASKINMSVFKMVKIFSRSARNLSYMAVSYLGRCTGLRFAARDRGRSVKRTGQVKAPS